MGPLVEMPYEQDRSFGRVAVLALGTANPPYYMEQSQLRDEYFKRTNNEQMTDVKRKFTRICKYINPSETSIIYHSNMLNPTTIHIFGVFTEIPTLPRGYHVFHKLFME